MNVEYSAQDCAPERSDRNLHSWRYYWDEERRELMPLPPVLCEDLMSRQTLAAQCFRALLCPIFERIRRSESLLWPLFPLSHFVVWVSVWVKNRIPVISDEDAVF